MRSAESSLLGIITALLSGVTRWVYISPMRSTVPSAFSVLMKLPAANGLAMVRVITGWNILWFLIPGYIIALTLSFFVPPMFTAIAFDSGGVASGPMTASFMLPFAMGACQALGGNVLTDAFGLVALVAMTPLITVQIMGVIYVVKSKRQPQTAPELYLDDNEIIELWEVG